ncbi:MAG: alpha-amylase family glycosyl hydrolase [Halanaerobiaceae bacterium]
MKHSILIHYDNSNGFDTPIMWVWVSDGATLEREVEPAGADDFGVYFDLNYNRSNFNFLFKDGKGEDVLWEDKTLERNFHICLGEEIWTMADRHNIYNVPPAAPQGNIKDFYQQIKDLFYKENFYIPSTDVSGLGIPSLLGGNILQDGSILFGFFHPRTARVYLTGNFNDWQSPGHPVPDEEQFIAMDLYRGFYYQPNIWLKRLKVDNWSSPVEYKFYFQGGAVENEKYTVDPYTRLYSDDYKNRNAIIVNPAKFEWTDQDWVTPNMEELIIYELNVYGFTDNDPDIADEHQGTFKGVAQRIIEGYFNKLGITAIELMPTAEVPMQRGLGYEPCTYMAVEKDFGTPDDFRELVDTAHEHGLAVILDQVFSHTSNDFNPLWNLIDDNSGKGGFYFRGETMWGNKLATGREEVDNMLIDSCKLFIEEYHVDGFRFDATHSYFLNHKLMHRLAHELRSGFKEDVILIAENLPNGKDLNLEGFNGYAQWSDVFHDKIKALLREGIFEDKDYNTENIGSMFYFAKDKFAAHTNNVVNFCESHDENSVQFEVGTGGEHLRDREIKSRKARLGLMATMVALGQPMIYMGQEYGIERERNRIKVSWRKYDEETSDFYRWTGGLINLRKRYNALRISSFDPIREGKFNWVIAPWLGEKRGGKAKVIGWRTDDAGVIGEKMLVLLNFEGCDINVDLDLNTPGRWVKLADIENVNDLPPAGDKNPEEEDCLISENGDFKDFVLPPYSGFIYKFYR